MQKGYWDNINNQRAFLDKLAKKLNITDQRGWYNIKLSQIMEYNGGGLVIGKYDGSLVKLITTVFPEYLNHRSIGHS